MKKMIALSVAAAMVLAGVYADDFDFSSDDFSFGGDDSSNSSPVEISGDINTSIRDYLNEAVDNTNNWTDTGITGNVDANLKVNYSGKLADGAVTFNFNSDTIKEHPEDVINELMISSYFGNFKFDIGKMNTVWGKGDKLHVLDNFNADDYTDFIIPDYLDRRISTPMIKASYGFNYSDAIVSNIKFEAVYTPFLPTDRFATAGEWVPGQVKTIKKSVTDAATNYVAQTFKNYTTQTATVATLKSIGADLQAATTAYDQLDQLLTRFGDEATAAAAYSAATGTSIDAATFKAMMRQFEIDKGLREQEYTKALKTAGVTSVEQAELNLVSAGTSYMLALNNASALSNDPDKIYPDTNTLKYGQFGGRLTFSLANLDLGLSYYNGYYKQPSFNGDKFNTYINKYLSNQTITNDDKFLVYDKKQTFGAEFATILWHFNVRGEFAYNMTDDFAGNNPFVHNHSLGWVGGFDIDLPFWDANLNVQDIGTYVLYYDYVSQKNADIDYSHNGPSKNRLVANLTTSFANGKFAPEVTVMYGIEYGDLIVMPKLVYSPTGELNLILSGMGICSKNSRSEFYEWRNNSFVQLGAELTF